MSTAKVIIVEDEARAVRSLKIHLQRFGYTVCGHFANGEEALAFLADNRPDLVIMDITLSGKLNGIETAKEIRSHWSIPILFLSGYAQKELLQQIAQMEHAVHLSKPATPDEIAKTLSRLLQYAKSRS